MERLDQRTIGRLGVPVPRYDRTRITPSVVHLGLGAFARAHLCAYLDELLVCGRDDVGVIGVSLRHDDVARALAPQDGLYTLGLVDGGGTGYRVIGSVLDVLVAPREPDRVREALASPSTRLITVTVTEKGYCWSPATRRLDREHPDVVHDVVHPDAPRSLPGHLVLAARDRRARGAGAVTVLSLDNLPSNGRTLEGVVTELAQAVDPTLAGWIAEHMAFPSSMVDRMVPATDNGFRAEIRSAVGVDDAWPVRAEPFAQWVVERRWVTAPPPLDEVGVQFVDDVGPWERLKLRVLNGLHTAAALYGIAHDLDTVDAVVGDAGGMDLLLRVAVEIEEVLEPPPGGVVADYIDTTLHRFANPGLGHRCAQIATDTSQKLPQRILDTLRERSRRGLDSPGILVVLALWAWSTLGADAGGRPRIVNDPLASRYADLAARHAGDVSGIVDELIQLEPVFGSLAGDPALAAGIVKAYADLRLPSLVGRADL